MNNTNSCETEMKVTNETDNTNNAFVILESQELNESEHDVLKGDTIGDTVYSVRWTISALKILSQLSDEEFTSNVETDLCMLWDMTADKDVVLFLLKFDIFDLIQHTLKCTSNPRLTEILLGITGNLVCFDEALQVFKEKDDLINAIFHYLTDSDSETLLQVIRIFKCIMWDIQKQTTYPWRDKFKQFAFFGSSLAFILLSSKHEQLLTATLDLMELITTMSSEEDKLLEQLFLLDQLMFAIFECFDQLFKDNLQNTESNLNKVKNWLTVYQYIVNTEQFKCNIEFEKETVYGNTTKVLDQILKSVPLGYTIPMSDVTIYCIGTSVEIMMWFLKNKGYYETDVIAIIPSLLISFKTDIKKTTIDKEELSQEIELTDYLEKSWSYILNALDQRNLYTIKMTCENLLKNEREVSEDNLQELIQLLNITDH